ncbi:MAG: adenylate/guanylate cyclase domain-containing protein, partial [Pseudomonadota bacterium]
CAAHHGIEKVKTVGDAYLAVAGGNSSRDKDAVNAIQFAQCLIREVQALSESTGIPVSVRVGIHTGNVVGGVVGAQRLAYDYWGSTMNVASRIESIAEPGTITVSESTYLEAFGKMAFSESRTVELKGVGQRKVYKVESAKELQTA